MAEAAFLTTPDSGAASVLARLAAKEEARRAERAQRQQESAALSDPREDVDHHLSAFNKKHAALAARATAAAAAAAELASPSPRPDLQQEQQQGDPQQHRAALQQELEDILAGVADLEQSTSAASYYLPSYDLKQAAAALGDVRAAIETTRTALAPRRKFAFSRRPAAGTAAINTSVAEAAVSPVDQRLPLDQQGGQQQQQQQLQQQQQPSAYDLDLIASGHGLRGLHGAIIVRNADDLGGREFVLFDLEGCDVFLLGEMRALRAARLTRCRVYAGPVRGAAFVDSADGCTLAIAAQQARVHHTTSCDLYLRAGSRPIIEACAGLRFAPLTDADLANLRLQGALTAAARLGEGDGGGDAGQELWRAVDDFGWVKATQSPNWAVLPEGERAAAPVPPPARTLDECAADNVLISPAAAAAVAAAVVAGGTVAAAKGAHE